MMPQEDKVQNFGDIRPCKKPKIPKRGVGVAQLEKNRVEEQQKKNEPFASPAISPSSSKPPYLVRSFPNFHHYNSQSSCSPISFPSSTLQSNAVIVPEHGIVPARLVLVSSLPHESNSNPITIAPKKWMQRTQLQRQQPPSSSMVNASSKTLSTPSLGYSMETPSNQNYWMLPDKMIGMKRPFPFATPMNMNETYCGSGHGFTYAANATFRKVPYTPTCYLEANYSNRSSTANENVNGGYYLTLAPATPPSLCHTSKFLEFHDQEYPHIEYYQEIIEDQTTQLPIFSGFNQLQQPLYAVIPAGATAAQIGQTRARIQNGNEVVGESVDLNLKL